MGSQASVNEIPGKDTDETIRNAALELAGLWKNRKDESHELQMTVFRS